MPGTVKSILNKQFHRGPPSFDISAGSEQTKLGFHNQLRNRIVFFSVAR
jgi:hypothetical protein